MTMSNFALRNSRGFTLVEVMVTMLIFAVVMAVVGGVFFSSNEMYTKTNRRAGMQMNGRMGMSLMAQEIRHAGCDPQGAGVTAIVAGTGNSLRFQADISGDGVIQTAEPSEDITYAYDADAQAITRNPGSGAAVVVPNVTGLTFTYLDIGNNVVAPPLTPGTAAQVRTIAITMTTANRDEDMTLTTSISLRNQE